FLSFLHHPALHPFPTRRSSDLRVLAALRHWLDEPPMMSPRCVVRAFLPLLLVALPSGAARAQTPGPLATSAAPALVDVRGHEDRDRKSTRLNSSHQIISYAVFC